VRPAVAIVTEHHDARRSRTSISLQSGSVVSSVRRSDCFTARSGTSNRSRRLESSWPSTKRQSRSRSTLMRVIWNHPLLSLDQPPALGRLKGKRS